jgi:hypothetical protein
MLSFSLVLVFVALNAVTVSAASAASGTFEVLSMNVAGLPEILNGNGESGDKTTNTAIIGQDMTKFAYDVIQYALPIVDERIVADPLNLASKRYVLSIPKNLVVFRVVTP